MDVCKYFVLFVALFGDVAYSQKPGEIDVVLDKASSDTGSENIYLGQTDEIILTAKFPDGVTEDVEVAFMPSLTNTALALGKIISYDVGSDISNVSNADWFTNAEILPGEEYEDPELKIYYNSMVIFDLGNITNDGTSGVEENSFINITFEIVYVSLSNYSVGHLSFPSAAITNGNNSMTTVSQERYILQEIDTLHAEEASFTLTGMADLEDGGQIETTDLTMNITHGAASVKMETFVLTETQSVSPVKIELISAGEAYNYSIRQEKMVASRYENCSVLDNTRQILALDVGIIVNKESQKDVQTQDNTSNLLIFRASWLVYDTTALGNSFSFGVGVDVNDEHMFVTSFNKTTIRRDPPATNLTNITTTRVGPRVVAPGHALSVDVTADTPPGSLHTYVVQLTTREVNGTESKLMILKHVDTARGDNLPCPPEEFVPFSLARTNPVNTRVTNEANFTFAVLNTGLMSTNHFDFTVKMLFFGSVLEGSVYDLVVNINDVESSVDFEVGEAQPFNVSFTATHEGAAIVLAGGFAAAKVTLHTREERADEYNVALKTREKDGAESKLTIVSHEFVTDAQDAPFLEDDAVNLTLANTDASDPLVSNEGNLTTFYVVNTGSLNSNDFEIVVNLAAFPDALNGTVYEVVVGVNGDEQVVEFTVAENEQTTSFTVTHVDTDVIPAGGMGKAEIAIETKPESVQYFDLNLATTEENGTESKLFLLSYSFPTNGGTSPSVLEDPVVFTLFGTAETNPRLKNAANMSVTILNDGKAASNLTVLHVDMIALPEAENGTKYDFVVDANGSNKTAQFTIGDPIIFNGSVAYEISLNITSNSRIAPGGNFTTEMTVKTTPNTMPGLMTIQLEPIETPYVTFFGARTQSLGENVVCPPTGSLDHTVTSWDEAAQDNAIAIINVPWVCNIKTVEGDAANIWVIKLDHGLLDHQDLQSAEQQVSFGVSVNFSNIPVYVANVTIVSVPENQPNQNPGSSGNQFGTVQENNLQPGDGGTTQWWWIAVGVASAMVLAAGVTAAVVIIKKKKNKNKTKVLKVDEYQHKKE